MEVIAKGLHQIIAKDPENLYFRRLSKQVDHAIAKGRIQANDLKESHEWLEKIAACLRYPPSNYPEQQLTGEQVAQEMKLLLQQFLAKEEVPASPDGAVRQIASFVEQLW